MTNFMITSLLIALYEAVGLVGMCYVSYQLGKHKAKCSRCSGDYFCGHAMDVGLVRGACLFIWPLVFLIGGLLALASKFEKGGMLSEMPPENGHQSAQPISRDTHQSTER
jgi:hypothetical protein